MEDLTTNNGPIKVVAENGTIIVNGGNDGVGVSAGGIGDVLLEARGAGSDVIVNASVSSGSGHITLNAADDVDINAALSTDGSGTVYLTGAGINIDASLTSVSGDVLIFSTQEISLTAAINSTSGDLGLIASLGISQSSAGDITTTSGDVLIEAGTNWTMSSGTVITAGGGDFDGKALSGDIALGQINASRVALTAGADISDANTTTLNVVGTSLSIRAGGMIGDHDNTNGTPSTNTNAIDTQVTTLAAVAGYGIYIEEANNLIINTVAAVNVFVDGPKLANFNSTITDVARSRTTDALEDLTTTNNGPIKVVTVNGTITVNGGNDSVGLSAAGTGDVLLEARGAGSDVIVNASVSSGSGHITLNAVDDVDVNVSVSTGGSGTIFLTGAGISLDASVTTANGDVLMSSTQEITQTAAISSTNGDIGLIAVGSVTQSSSGDITTNSGDVLVEGGMDWTMSTGTVITAGGGDFDGKALNGDLALGRINAARTALSASGDISDANGTTLNVDGTSLSMRAGGRIGIHDNANGTPSTNTNAIDTQITTLAAVAGTGIYIEESNSLIIDTVATVNVSVDGPNRANFNSTSTAVPQSRTTNALEDLATLNNGPIKIVTLNGTIIVNDGTTGSVGIKVNGTGDVLLEARGAGSDVIVNAAISSGGGHVTLNAVDDVDVNASLSTEGSGTVYLTGDGVSLHASVTTLNGDVFISSAQQISQTAAINSTCGDVGLIAVGSVTQSSGGDITTTSGDVLIEAGTDWTMSNGTVITAGGGDFDGKALNGDLALGRINSARTALSASGDIIDANGTTLNVDGTSLSMRAGGRIGNHDNTNGAPSTNTNAIDTQVTTLAAVAGSGIYIEEANSLTIDTVAAVKVSVDGPKRANFNSTTTNVALSRMTNALEDLTTTNTGPIKVVTANGSITVNDGTPVSAGITANGIGDVLLEARGAGSDVIVNTTVSSGSGHVTLNAVDDVDVNASLSTGGLGTVYVTGAGISLDASVTTLNGDVLIFSTQEISQTAAISSTSGDVGLIASHGISQLSAGDITTTAGDVLIEAGTDWTMSTGTVIIAGGGDFDGKALNGDLALGRIDAARTALSASGDISDANGTTLNVNGTSLSLRAGAMIGDHDNTNGTPSSNTNAIDTQITALAALAGVGIYIEESNSLIIDTVAAVNVSVDGPQRANFNSTTIAVPQSRTTNALEDLTTTNNGPIKIVTLNGTITVNGGNDSVGLSAAGTGDVLLDARGAGSDVIVNAAVSSGSGHVTLNAVDDVDVNASITTGGLGTVYITGAGVSLHASVTTGNGDVLISSTQAIIQTAALNSTSGDVGLIASLGISQASAGDITTTTGDVLIEAGTDWTMSNGTVITAGGGDFDGKALTGDLALGRINSARTALSASGDISDANGTTLNVDGTSLSMRAGGRIGNHDNTNGTPSTNTNAIDTQITTLAAVARTGIYIEESNGLIIDTVAAVNLSVDGPKRANFNSTITAVPQSRTRNALDDLTTTNNGPIKIVTVNGTITVNGGNDSVGLSAGGMGDVLLEARGAGSDVIVNAAVSSGSGHITLNAADDVDINAALSTDGSGTVYLTGAGISIDASLTTVSGDVLIFSTQEISLTAAINSTSGDLGLIAVDSVTQSSSGDITTTSGDVLIEAGTNWTMSSGTVITAGGGDFDGKALSGEIALGQINASRVALTAGADISDANTTTLNVVGTSLSIRAGGMIGDHDNTNGTPSTNTNAIDTQITTLAAVAGSGIYIEEANNLTIDAIAAVNVSVDGPRRANFNSTTTNVALSRTTNALEDLTTTNNGPIKIVTANGSITVNDGTTGSVGIAANGTGDVLLEARGTSSDVTINGFAVSSTGHISVKAADDVILTANLATGGSGTVYVTATNQNTADLSGIRMSSPATITTAGGNVRLVSDNESDILLGRINAATGSVSLLAERSILDSNGALQNVQAHVLRIVADAAVSNSANQAGIIGGSDTAAAAMSNINAIDTTLDVLAAQSADGIYIKESDGLTVDATAAILVDEARFNGSTTQHLDASLSDLTTSHNGVIKLQTVTGSVVLNEGGDGNGTVINANGTGDVLIESLASNGDVIVSGQIQSGTGHITLNAGDDVIVNRAVTTSGAGTIFLSASSGTADSIGSVADGVTLTAALNSLGGDVLVKSDVDVILAAAITNNSGNIGVMAGRDLTQTNEGDIASITGDVLLLADRHWTNDSDAVIHAGGGELIGRARTGDVVLGRIDATHAAITAGRNLLDANGGLLNVTGQTLSLRAGGSIGTSVDRLETRIATLAAQSATGIFLDETDSLTIDTVGAITVSINSPVRVNLNSTTTSVGEVRTLQSLEDLTTTGNGPIQILTRAGSLTINGGADSIGITSEGTGAIQLTAVGASSDIVVNASLSSGTGNIQLTADDDLDVNASLQTDGGGKLNLSALNSTASDFAALAGSEVDGINIDASLITGDGDVLLTSALDIRQSAGITSNAGDVIFTAGRDVFETSSGDITTSLADVLINAGRNWTMGSNTVITSSLGNVGGITVAGEIFLGRINASEVVLQSFAGIQDNNSTQLNVVSQRLSLKAGRSTGDDSSNSGTFSANSDAIDTQVNQLAVESPTGIAINERDDLIINGTTSQTIGGTSFDAVTGMQTVNSDIFLNVGGDLTLNSQLRAGTADVRITASGNVIQNMDGIVVADELGIRQISTGQADIRLFTSNDVNVLSASNAFDGGDIQFHDADDLIIRTVSAQTVGLLQFDGVSGIVATGGDIEIRAEQDLTILKTIVSSNGMEDRTLAGGEKITLESVDGNILIDATNGPILITSDEAPGSNAVTGDQIVLLADSDGNYNGDLDGDQIPDSVDKDIDGDGILNSVDSVLNGRIQGQVKFVGDVTLSTDGGVAKKFAKRPEVGLPATAFFVYASKPMPLAIDNSPVSWVGENGYLDGFFIEVGVQGEENLVLDLDWQDPANEPGVVNDPLIQQGAQASGIIHAVSSERLQQFFVADGGNVNTVGHVYTARDFTLFQQVQNITTIVVDFSVSHHSSIDVQGVSVSQANATEIVPGRDLASTDNRNTFPGLFENGIATFKIPTVTPAPPALFNNATVARVDRPFAVSVPEQRTVTSQALTTDFGGGAVSGSAFSTEVYFQIRRQFEADGPAEVVVERITDSSLISSREAFEKFVQQTPALQDGAGYEIWLISETGGQKVERPIVEFENHRRIAWHR